MPTEATCSIDGCERTVWSRGWCGAHYKRWHAYGDPEAGRGLIQVRGNESERFWRKVLVTDSCWLWTGSRGNGGYGIFRVGGRGGRGVLAHRWAYEHLVGPIPSGMHIDHVHANGCRNTHCVRMDHLEIVTPEENARRKKVVMAARTHCKWGHPWTDFYLNGKGCRVCRVCVRERRHLRPHSDRDSLRP